MTEYYQEISAYKTQKKKILRDLTAASVTANSVKVDSKKICFKYHKKFTAGYSKLPLQIYQYATLIFVEKNSHAHST